MMSRFRKRHSLRFSMGSVQGREEAHDLAPTDWSRAREVARKIPDGWYRAQALAKVATHAPESHVLEILSEAVQAANACHDEYGIVAVLSWPLEVAFRRGRISFAVRERDRAIALAPRIEPLPSRAFALQFLWGSCYLFGPQYAEPVWDAIVALCPPDWSWRAAGLYQHIAQVREHCEPGTGAAAEVLRAMPERARPARSSPGGSVCPAEELRLKGCQQPASSPPPPML